MALCCLFLECITHHISFSLGVWIFVRLYLHCFCNDVTKYLYQNIPSLIVLLGSVYEWFICQVLSADKSISKSTTFEDNHQQQTLPAYDVSQSNYGAVEASHAYYPVMFSNHFNQTC